MTAARIRTASPDKATVELYKDAMFGAGAALQAGVTTTYRIVPDATVAGPLPRSEPPMSISAGLQQWLRRQHPADVVRIILMLAAVGAVILAIVRLG